MSEDEHSFDLTNHFFIINDLGPKKQNIDSNERLQNIICTSKTGIFKYLNMIGSDDALIVHNLVRPYFLLYALFHKQIMRTSVWVIWGGDLYAYRTPRTSLKSLLIEWLRRQVIPKFSYISCFIEGDFEIAKQVYLTKAKYIYSFYPSPIDNSSLLPVEKKNSIQKKILVGNSGTSSNNHIEAYKLLARFKYESIQIITPLSYGDDDDYVKQISECCRTLFGDKSKILLDFMPPSEYARLLDEIDVAIMNHDRQQALGNICSLLALGKKVFINDMASHYEGLIEKGLCIYPVSSIEKLSLDELCSMPKEAREMNSALIKTMLSDESCVKAWGHLYDVVDSH